jgi:glycosyltransferase involved in cell wall biosynthesis
MKIALVTDAIYPYNKGGKETRTYQLSTRLAQKGHDVHIYTMNWWNGEKIKKENGVTLHGISKLYPLYSGERRSIKEAIFFALSCFQLLIEDFEVMEVDHMPHLVLFSTKIVSILKKKKLYASWNEVWGREYWVEYMGFFGNIAYIIEWLSARIPDEINSISEHTTQKLKKILKVNLKINTIPMGIDLPFIESIKPASLKSDIIYAGRLIEHKNIDILIYAVSNLKIKFPNIKCLIIGKGPEEEKLKKLVNDLQLNRYIIFIDFLENYSDLYALMKSSKVFAFPTTREGFGIVALEANACNIPIITTNHEDNASKVLVHEGENGLIINLSTSELSIAISSLMTNNNRPNLRRYVNRYSWSSIVEKHQEVIKT